MQLARSTALFITVSIASLAFATPARANPHDGDTSSEVLKELRRLRDRVGELEQWKTDRQQADANSDATSDQSIRQAIDAFLAKQDPATLTKGAVRAPRSLGIDFGGQFRARGEVNNESYAGVAPNGGISDNFWLGRTRLNAKVRVRENLQAFVEIQDARAWGTEAATAANSANTDLSQGWVEFHNVAGKPLTVRLGRQATSLSDQRLIGALEWSNNGRRFDGLTATWKDEDYTATSFAYRVGEGGFAGKDSDLYGTWWEFPEALGHSTLEAFAIYMNSTVASPSEPRGPSTLSTTAGRTRFGTYGFRLHGAEEDGSVDWDMQAATQRGRFAGDRMRAYSARGGVGVRLSDDESKPRLGVEYNYASGDRRTNDGKRQQFETLFPTNHGHYGIHDYASLENTRSWGANVSMSPSKGVKLKLSYWRFKLDETAGGWTNAGGGTIRPGVNSGANRSIGEELDFVVSWQVDENVQWQFGWAHFMDGEFIRDTQTSGSAHDSDFAYIQCLVNF